MEDEELRRRAEGAYAEFRMRLDDGQAAELEELCTLHPELATVLRELDRDFGAALELLPGAGGAPAPEEDGLARQLLSRLRGRAPAARYRVEERVDEGGQGEILRVWDEDLDRRLAMKRMHTSGALTGEGASPVSRALGRFLEEAKLTGQLDHPGICPVHELGLDEEGRVWFTMKLVEGESLKRIIERVHAGDPEWTRTRVLGVLLRVCEAAGYAHRKGVLHRDIKPSNVMVGRFGEVYLMDWGLAKVIGRARAEGRPPSSEVHSVREREGSSTGSPLLTGDGDIVGTPSYMSPEQARGELDSLSPASDVYSVGAILYQLLTGAVPYLDSGTRPSNLELLTAVQAGPPAPIGALVRGVPAELVAICEKAMARRPRDRYDDLGALADDLRATLEGRVVAAHATGAWVELKKWVHRNREVAAAAGVLVAVLIASALWILGVERQRRELAQRTSDEFLAAELVRQASGLGPVHPDHVEVRREWLREAERLVGKLDEYRSLLDETGGPLEPRPGRATKLDHVRHQIEHWDGMREQLSAELGELDDASRRAGQERAIRILEGQRPRLELQLARLAHASARPVLPAGVRSERERERLTHALMVWNLEALSRRPHGWIERVERELEQAERLRAASLDAHADEWAAAIEEIADPERCPAYGGLRITPQLGLVPLGRNEGGLWEFWHTLSGSRPARSSAGGYELDESSGIVLVLIPGGEYVVGAQSLDRAQPNFTPAEVLGGGAVPDSELPVRSVRLEPWFHSKYELTQAQWVRLAGTNPSTYFAGADFRGMAMLDALHPVESLGWEEASSALESWSLELPTEAQWEAAARAGTEGPYWWGDLFAHGGLWANSADVTAARHGLRSTADLGFDDGWALHAPVHAYLENPFGLVNVIGNVAELCADWFEEEPFRSRHEPGTGLMEPDFANGRAYRGGGFLDTAFNSRVSRRQFVRPSETSHDLGVRPARPLIH